MLRTLRQRISGCLVVLGASSPCARPCESIELPRVGFIENAGQWTPSTRFGIRLSDSNVRLERDALMFGLVGERDQGAVVRLTFEGAGESTSVAGESILRGRHHFLQGDDPAKWVCDVESFQSVLYQDIHPGVDARCYLQEGHLKYDLLIAPGVDLERVILGFDGATLSLDASGTLVAATPVGHLSQPRPVAFEVDASGARREVPCSFRLLDENRFCFEVAQRHPDSELVIDPTLFYSSYLGGSGFDQAWAVEFDSLGNSCIAGYTESTDFPTTPGAYDRSVNGAGDAFVAKLDPDGALVFATYLGGTAYDLAYGLAVDSAGAIYVVGQTLSTNFPSTWMGYAGGGDAFLTKLSAAGNAIVYSTFLGGSAPEYADDVTVDDTGAALVVGGTSSSNFPTTAGAYDRSYNSGNDVFVTKVKAAGTAFSYSTYLGGSSSDVGHGIAVHEYAAYVTGETTSGDFPMVGAFDTFRGGTEAFVTKLDAVGSALLFSSYISGGGTEVAGAIAVSHLGEAVVVGSTTSGDFPVTSGGFDPSYNGGGDAFVLRVIASGSAISSSTFLGGAGSDGANDVVLTSTGEAWVTGTTTPSGFPTTADAFDRTYGFTEAFVSRLSSSGSTLLFSSLLGGAGEDFGYTVALDQPAGELLIAGTTSGSFPTTPNAYDPTYAGGYDAFVSKLEFASWSNYGVGWPGSSGTPKLTATAEPVLCSTIDLKITNSRGRISTTGYLLVGLEAVSLPTSLDGTLLVLPISILTVQISSSGLTLPVTVPCDNNLSHLPVFLQVLEFDPGASKGMSFTAGLKLVLGH